MESASLEIDSADVIKLVLQFLKENNLTESWKALSSESEVCMNTIDNVDSFILDIQHGKWESVLTQINTLKLPIEKLYLVYEQIIMELLEFNERELAKEILTQVEPMKHLKQHQVERYLKLEHLCRRPFFNVSDVYESGTTKESKRQEIVDILLPELSIVPPSRLLALINHALRYQSSQGMLPKNTMISASSGNTNDMISGISTSSNNSDGIKYDLFKGCRRAAKKDNEEKIPKRMSGKIRFTATSHPETVTFALDGQSLITGSVDGFIEVWDTETCKIRNDLEYQEKDEFMLHDDNEAILCCALNRADLDVFATGSEKGVVKIWKLSTGVCIRRFDHAHPQGITSISFGASINALTSGTGSSSRSVVKDKEILSQLLTTSFDCTARIHGLKSGKALKEFRGHTSYVNCGIFTKDGSQILTGSSDSHVKLWDTKTAECVASFRPGSSMITSGMDMGIEVTVHTITLMPLSSTSSSASAILSSSITTGSITTSDYIFICGKSPYAYITTLQGRVIRTFTSSKTDNGDFLCACISPQGNWVYCVGEDGMLYMFDAHTGSVEGMIDIFEEGNSNTSTSISSNSNNSNSIGTNIVTNSSSTSSSSGRKEVIGISHHPHRNLLVTITDDGQLKLWRP